VAALTEREIEPLFTELERYPGVTEDLDETDRSLYTRAVRYCRDTHDLWAVRSAIRTNNGNGRGRRPSVREVEDLAKDLMGVDEQPAHIKPLPELVRGWEQDAAQNREETEPGQPSARDRARAMIASLVERTGKGLSPDHMWSYGPEIWKSIGENDPDPMTGVPRDDQAALIAEATALLRSMIRWPHPRGIRELAAKLYHNRQGALRDVAERRRHFAAVLGGHK
jgi:hypothetical protein